MAASGLECELAGCKYWVLSNFMQIHGFVWPRQGLVYIFLTFDKSLGFLLDDFSKFWPRLSVMTGFTETIVIRVY